MANSIEYLGLTPLQTAMLASVSHDDKTSLLDSDNHFIIDSITKTISSQGGKKEFGRGAHNSDVITFECDRYIEGHDMTLCNVIRIHYLNGNNPGTYDVNDMAVKSDDDTKATFTWTITSNVTASLGKIRFAIAFKCVQEDDSVSYCMPTKINEELSVFDTIDNSETVVQENYDILEQWKQDLFDISEREIGEAVAAYLAENPPSGASDEQVQNAVNNYMAANPIDESDPTVPGWAKQPEKPTYTSSEVGADAVGTADGKVSAHNTAGDAHNDIRELISGLTQRLNALADSDDTTLDQMSEVVAYIKSNKSLIDIITTSKVNVSDIIDNLTTNASNKPLSAAQGVALKTMIDAIATVELDETLTDNTKAAPAGMVGELKGDLSQLSEDIANKGGNVSASYDGNGTIVFGNSSNHQTTQYENGDEVSY